MAFASNDPRSKGFNYGAPIPVPTQGIYPKLVALANRWRRHDTQKGRERSWDLDMALRFVRCSCSHHEQSRALDSLAAQYGGYLK